MTSSRTPRPTTSSSLPCGVADAAATFEFALLARAGSPVQRLVLEAPPGFRFRAGQYIEVVHPDGTIPLSIASAPWRLPAVHLHYRSTPGLDTARWMDELLDGPPHLRVRGPSGLVTLPDRLTGPLLLVAAGTGIAQVLALLEELASRGVPADHVAVQWYIDDTAGAYCTADLEAALPGIHVEFVNSGRLYDKSADAHGAAAVAAAHPDAQAIIAGSPAFVYDACATLCAAGMDPQHIQSDVFEYAPRDGFGKQASHAARQRDIVDKQARGE